jgi:hypothetical protein
VRRTASPTRTRPFPSRNTKAPIPNFQSLEWGLRVSGDYCDEKRQEQKAEDNHHRPQQAAEAAKATGGKFVLLFHHALYVVGGALDCASRPLPGGLTIMKVIGSS